MVLFMQISSTHNSLNKMQSKFIRDPKTGLWQKKYETEVKVENENGENNSVALVNGRTIFRVRENHPMLEVLRRWYPKYLHPLKKEESEHWTKEKLLTRLGIEIDDGWLIFGREEKKVIHEGCQYDHCRLMTQFVITLKCHTQDENHRKHFKVHHERSFSEDCHFTLEKVCMGIGVRENLPDDYFSGETNQIMIPQKGVREMTVSDNGNNTQEWEFKDLDEEASSIWLKSAENEIFSGGVN